jgi:hypothetical protein
MSPAAAATIEESLPAGVVDVAGRRRVDGRTYETRIKMLFAIFFYRKRDR